MYAQPEQRRVKIGIVGSSCLLVLADIFGDPPILQIFKTGFSIRVSKKR
jgi:hypothetical protein